MAGGLSRFIWNISRGFPASSGTFKSRCFYDSSLISRVRCSLSASTACLCSGLSAAPSWLAVYVGCRLQRGTCCMQFIKSSSARDALHPWACEGRCSEGRFSGQAFLRRRTRLGSTLHVSSTRDYIVISSYKGLHCECLLEKLTLCFPSTEDCIVIPNRISFYRGLHCHLFLQRNTLWFPLYKGLHCDSLLRRIAL